MAFIEKKILVGVPELTHKQLANGEISGLKDIGYDVITSLYGGVSGYTGWFSRFYIIIANSLKIRKLVKKEKVDVVYLNTAFDVYALVRDFISLFFIRQANVKIMLKSHGSNADFLKTKNTIYRFMIKKLSHWSDGFGVLSSEERLNFIKAGFIPEKVFVLKNIIATDVYFKDNEFRKKNNIPGNVPLLFFIGRFIPLKGLIDVIRALSIVKKNKFDFTFLCVGDGPESSGIKEEINRLDLSNNVIFTGFIEEEKTTDFYANADMLLFPSQSEGFALAIFKSVAAGLPIITTRIRAAADYLSEPDNCLWVEQKNPEMLAEKVIYLLNNPDVCQKMSNNNKNLAHSFSQQKIASELDLIIKKITGC